jgi:hypothetical protein
MKSSMIINLATNPNQIVASRTVVLKEDIEDTVSELMKLTQSLD